MAKGKGNGTILKVMIGILGLLLTAGLTSALWIWNASGYCKDIETNTAKVVEMRDQLKRDIIPKVDANSMAVIGIQKDIVRLNEKVEELNVEQKDMRAEQQMAFREILDRLPE